MRLLGTTLMGFGGFCISVVLASVLGPMLRSGMPAEHVPRDEAR